MARYEGGGVVEGAGVCTREIPHLPLRLLRVVALLPQADGGVFASTVRILRAIETWARSVSAVEIRVDCLILDGVQVGGVCYSAEIRRALESEGYKNGGVVLPRPTYLVRIDRDDESLIQSFRDNCRRDVRKGLREGAKVEALGGVSDFRAFCEAHTRMLDRKGIQGDAVGYDHFLPMFERGDIRLFGVSIGGKLRSMAVVDTMGTPRYVLGAATPDLYEKGLPPMGQPLQFEIMRWLRDRAKTHYDLGGAPGPIPTEGHSNFSVWRFKYGFAGEFVTSIPVYRRPVGRLGGLIAGAIHRLDRARKGAWPAGPFNPGGGQVPGMSNGGAASGSEAALKQS